MSHDWYGDALSSARTDLSMFVDLVGDRFSDYLSAEERVKYPSLATPEKQEPARAFAEAIWQCWKDHDARIPQTLAERAIGQAVHVWMMDACRQVELNHNA